MMLVAEKIETLAVNQERVYQAGIQKGFLKGKEEGYLDGHAEGYRQGTTEGFEEGQEKGFQDGFESGYTDGYSLGESAGRQAEYDAFWDAAQNFGKRRDYALGLSGAMFTAETFKPKYPIRPTTAANAFAYWGQYGYPTSLIDFRNIVLDLSECTNVTNMFMGNRQVVAIGVMDCRACGISYQNIFSNARNLEIVEKFILKDGLNFNSAFDNCLALHTINFEGTIGRSINFQWSPLSRESIISVVYALSDSANGQTATFNRSAVNTAFETSEGAADGSTSEAWLSLVATKSNWTISLI